MRACFNPAEAEEGFKRRAQQHREMLTESFNPAEAEEGFKRLPSVFAMLR